MKILCYHGTSAEFLPSILTEGLKASADKVWNVSEDAVYCYSKNYLKDIQGSSIEESEDSFIRAAAESGMTAVIQSRKDCRICVIKFEVDESELETDYSCPNMEFANCIRRDIKPEEIRQVFISDDLSSYRFFIAYGVIHNKLFNNPLSELEKDIVRGINGDVFYENFDEIVNMREYGTNAIHTCNMPGSIQM